MSVRERQEDLNEAKHQISTVSTLVLNHKHREVKVLLKRLADVETYTCTDVTKSSLYVAEIWIISVGRCEKERNEIFERPASHQDLVLPFQAPEACSGGIWFSIP